MDWLKVSKSQNKFMKSSFLPKNERNIARISALTFRAEILAIFRSFFGRNSDFINFGLDHELRTPSEDINQRNLKTKS